MWKPVLFSFLLVVAVVSWLSDPSRFLCPSEINIEIGEFSSKESGLRASIPMLAAQIDKCPHADMYRIIWVGPGDDGERLRRSTIYYRTNSAIGYEADAFSGASEMGYVINDDAIRNVAKSGGTLEDFAGYDQRTK